MYEVRPVQLRLAVLRLGLDVVEVLAVLVVLDDEHVCLVPQPLPPPLPPYLQRLL